MSDSKHGLVKQRQEPLREHYRITPEAARITDGAGTVQNGCGDPFHTTVAAGQGHDALWRVGIHRAVGGDHDLPNPGDILCAALASCLDSTLRMIADRLEIPIAFLVVTARAEVDVRGTLLVDRSVPVGFQQMKCQIHLETAPEVPPEKVKMLLAAAEHSCVVFQTLRNGVPVHTQFDNVRSTADLAAR
jgi:uncharacterized OsmC-like protein